MVTSLADANETIILIKCQTRLHPAVFVAAK